MALRLKPLLRPGASLWPSTKPHRTFGQCRKLSIAELDRRKGDRERVVILGSGWSGFVLSRQLSGKKFQVVVVSPRSYFVFTPLLAGSTVGSQEFRTILEPVRNRKYPHVEFMQAWADDVDLDMKKVTLEESVLDPKQSIAPTADRYEDYTPGEELQEKRLKRSHGKLFDLKYDKLVVAVGSYSQTFGTPGVRENAYFLKDVSDARRIRKRVLECFEIASLPTTSDELRRQILNFAVIGGGPTGMEFAAELSDLVHEDMARIYPQVQEFVKVTVYDVAPTVLSMFDETLAKYAGQVFARQNIDVKTSHHVESLRKGLPARKDGSQPSSGDDSEGCYTLNIKEIGEIGVGACIWSTGNMSNPFVRKALDKVHAFPSRSIESRTGELSQKPDSADWIVHRNPRTGALRVDDQFRMQLGEQPSGVKPEDLVANGRSSVKSAHVRVSDVFAVGDTANLADPLPATAQVANQEALWLGKRLNKDDFKTAGPFTFKNLGVMAYLGNARGLLQTGGHGHVSGRVAWLIWRGAYVSMAISVRNKILIPVYWVLNYLFGRDITRF